MVQEEVERTETLGDTSYVLVKNDQYSFWEIMTGQKNHKYEGRYLSYQKALEALQRIHKESRPAKYPRKKG